MSRKSFVPLNVVSLAAAPASPAEGDVYINTTTQTLNIYTGSEWLTVVEFGSHDYLQLDTAATPTEAEGLLWWGAEDGTLHVGMADGVIQQVGMELYMPPTNNNSGAVIPNGAFVMATGVQGDRITIAKAITDGSVDAKFMIGVATHEIPIGGTAGKITTHGQVSGLNTSAWAVGTVLYPDPTTPGGWTATQPSAPAIKTPIAFVTRQHASTGRIMVRMALASELGGSDTNVEFGTLADRDAVVYDTTSGLWSNMTLATTYYQTTEPTDVIPGDIWVDSDATCSTWNSNDCLLKSQAPKYVSTEPTDPYIGQLWVNPSENVLKVWSGTEWVYLAALTSRRWTYTADGGETSLSGNDDNGNPLEYTAGFEQFFLNGVLLVSGVDYVAATGTSITGLSALTAGDIVEFIATSPFSPANTYTISEVDATFVTKAELESVEALALLGL